MSDRCTGTTLAGAPCTRTAGASGLCDRHDPEAARARGRIGRSKQIARAKAERLEIAAAVRVATVAEIREVLTAAIRMAAEEGNVAVMVSGARVAIDLLKTGELEAQLAELQALVAARLPGATHGGIQ